MANEYAGWETDEIIAVETVRNLVLSLVCVFVTTLALIQDLRAVLLVLASVLLTMVFQHSDDRDQIYFTLKLLLG